MLSHLVAFTGNYFVLKFFANGSEIGIVAGNAHEQVTVILRMLLRITQQVCAKHIDLQSAAAILNISVQESFEFIAMFRITQNGRVEGDCVTASVRQHVQILGPIAFAIPGLTAHHLADRVDVCCRTLDVGPVGWAYRV
jgi:hypothetical protein